MMRTPKLGDEKDCTFATCEGIMVWTRVTTGSSTSPNGESVRPKMVYEYEAWVCDTCKSQRPQSPVAEAQFSAGA
jgi:hypothetical protein